ncbi:MAG: hypothetical protein WKF30_01075 [Pyrinomonadaceae bacterium]
MLRRIYVAVRDHNWTTIPARLFHLHVDERPDSFRLTFEAERVQNEIDFYWRAEINGDAQGPVTEN